MAMIESIPYALAFAIVGTLAVAAAWDVARSKLARWDAIATLRESFEAHERRTTIALDATHQAFAGVAAEIKRVEAKADDLASVAREMRVAKNLGSARRS